MAVGDAARVKPDGSVIARNVCHPVGGSGSGLCRQLHISFDLADVLTIRGLDTMSHVDWLSRRYLVAGIPLFAWEKMVLL
jgi:hypothetical protein